MTENAAAAPEGNPEPLAEETEQMSPADWHAALQPYCDEDGNIPRERLAKLARDLSAREKRVRSGLIAAFLETNELIHTIQEDKND